MALLNRLSRREFFRLVLSAIATGTLCSSPAIAAAIEQVEPNPIAEVVIKARRIVAFNQQKRADMVDPALALWHQENEGLFDAMISYVVGHFRAETTNVEEVRLLLTDRQALGIKGDLLDEAELHRLTEGLVPVAVICELLMVHRTELRPQHIPGWRPFATKYWIPFATTFRDMIVA
jgi:hypothetical protein